MCEVNLSEVKQKASNQGLKSKAEICDFSWWYVGQILEFKAHQRRGVLVFLRSLKGLCHRSKGKLEIVQPQLN